MAERRMFTKKITESDAFLDMPLSTQCLYFHLNMAADDEGFVNNTYSIIRAIRADASDLSTLLDRGYVDYMNTDLHITHWDEHRGIEENHRQRNSYAYRKWREKVLERDGYSCRKCGETNNLHAHHIKEFSLYPKLRFDVDNGITLCEDCHRKLHGLLRRNSNG